MMKKLAVLSSIFLAAALAYMISDYYEMAPPPYFLVVLVALGLFIQTVIIVLQYNDLEETETEHVER